jgi:hypothetical protein
LADPGGLPIKDLARQLMPMTPLTGDLGKADLAVLEAYADPRALLAVSTDELTHLITTTPNKQQGEERTSQWRAAAAAAAERYRDHPAVAIRWTPAAAHSSGS